MGLFTPKTTVAPGIRLSAPLAAKWPLLAAGETTAIHITPTPRQNVPLVSSKFGGDMLLPNDIAWPTDSRGRKLVPVAQINYAEAPHLHGHPTAGWLQFYTGADGSFGLNDDNPIKADNFRVLFFDSLDEQQAQVVRHDPDESPVATEHALAFSLQQEYTGIRDIRFTTQFGQAEDFAESFGRHKSGVWRELHQYFLASQHKMGGYAWFATGPDPRGRNILFRDYILLLQIVHTPGKTINWGHEGVGNYFIHPDDLHNKDFSKVLFYWDTVG